MKELYFTLPYRRTKKTVRLKYGQVKKKFIVRTYDGEINGRRTAEDSPKEEVIGDDWVSDKYGPEASMDAKKEKDLQWLIDKKLRGKYAKLRYKR